MQMLAVLSSRQRRSPRVWRTVWLAILVLTVCGISAAPLAEWAIAGATAMRGAGPLGPLLYVVSYTICTFLMLPAALLTLFAGFVYGPVWGFLLALPTATLAGTLHFSAVRRFGRPWVADWLSKRPKLAAINQATSTQGFQLVLLLRLSPVVPFAMLNCVMALSQLKFWHFVGASMLGKVPVTILHVYLASAATELSDLGATRESPSADLLFWGGLLSTLIACVLVSRAARRGVSTALAAPPALPGSRS